MAALRAFTASPSLPLDEAEAEAGALRGRRRLGGAFLIETDRIRPDPAQPRKNLDNDAQQELTASVRRLGILQPITVRYIAEDDVYQVISGERRFQAARAAGLAELPCWVQTPQAQDILLQQIVENWQRADLHPYELADALACLRDALGYSQKQLAELTGKPESEISRLLSLLKLDPAVQQVARKSSAGPLTRRHLVAMARLPREDQQEVMIAVQDRGLTAIDTEKLVQATTRVNAGNRRGAPVGQRLRYQTSKATVTLSFRRRAVTVSDILHALEEARGQVEQQAGGEGEGR